MFHLKDIVLNFGMRKVGHVRYGPEEQLIPAYIILNNGIISKWMNNTVFPIRGISLYPVGIFISAQENNIEIIKHECFHYEEQSKCGMVAWLIAYYFEIATLSLKHGSFNKGYFYSSREQKAIDWSKSA